MDEVLKQKILDAIKNCSNHEYKDVNSRLLYLSGFLESDYKEISELLDYCYSNVTPVLF